MAKLQNGDKAIVDKENKLLGYSLNINHVDKRTGKLKGGNHAIHFRDLLGITTEHVEMLVTALRKAAAENEAELKSEYSYTYDDGTEGYVRNYEVRFTMLGPNGRTAEIISAWKITLESDIPQLTSCYPAKR